MKESERGRQYRVMYRLLLITLITTVSIWAEVKSLYTIQDVNAQTASNVQSDLLLLEAMQVPVEQSDDELMPMEHIFDASDEETQEEKKPLPVGLKKSQEELEIERIRKELNIGYKVPKKESTFDRRVNDIKEGIDTISVDSAISSIKSTLGMDSKKQDTGFSITDSLSNFGDTIGMDISMPDFLGFGGSKKKESGIFDSVTDFGYFGDVKDSASSMYKGAKYSGQSAEMMTGMMYNSSKMYNNMFGMFDDSPLNVFEEEEEASMFDVFEHGNSVMDMFND